VRFKLITVAEMWRTFLGTLYVSVPLFIGYTGTQPVCIFVRCIDYR